MRYLVLPTSGAKRSVSARERHMESWNWPLSLFLPTKGFATLVREWPGELYNNMAIVQAVSDHLKRDPSNSTLLTTLAELCVFIPFHLTRSHRLLIASSSSHTGTRTTSGMTEP